MKSRMEKYYQNEQNTITRTEKHIDTYKELYGSGLDSYDILPVSSNVNIIDIDTLKKLTTRDEYKKNKHQEESDDLWNETNPKGYEENKIYDINELIEKTKQEKEVINASRQKLTNYEYLAKLENKNPKDSIKDEIKQELLKLDKELENVKKDINPALDILTDLKGDDNTVTIKPMNEEEQIITNTKIEQDFYSGPIEFDSEDFKQDEDKEAQEKSSIWFKITIITLTIIAVVLAIIYTIKNI